MTFCYMSHIGMTDSTVIGQYYRQWLAKIISYRPVNHELGWTQGATDRPRGRVSFGCFPPLKCIRLCKQQTPTAARGCILVRRGQCVMAKAWVRNELTRHGMTSAWVMWPFVNIPRPLVADVVMLMKLVLCVQNGTRETQSQRCGVMRTFVNIL